MAALAMQVNGKRKARRPRVAVQLTFLPLETLLPLQQSILIFLDRQQFHIHFSFQANLATSSSTLQFQDLGTSYNVGTCRSNLSPRESAC
jgi:hypothetical protein